MKQKNSQPDYYSNGRHTTLFPFYWEEDTLTKEVDFSNEVDDVEQEGEAWCVYASMEAVDGMPQCMRCFNYIFQFFRR